MRNKIVRQLSLLMVFVMLFTMLPVNSLTARADTPEYKFLTQPGGEDGLLIVDETGGKDKAVVNFTLDFEPTALYVVNGGTGSIAWEATSAQLVRYKTDWTNVVYVPATSFWYNVVAWSPDSPQGNVRSEEFTVRNYVRTVQVHDIGTVDPEEAFEYGDFDEMVPYGAKYYVSEIAWYEFNASDNLCDISDSENYLSRTTFDHNTGVGKSMTFQKGRKYRAAIEVITTGGNRFKYKSEAEGIEIGEGKQFEDIYVNGRSYTVDTDYSYTAYNGDVPYAQVLRIVTEPVETGAEPVFTQRPAELTGVEPGEDARVEWSVNFPQKKVRLCYADGTYFESEGESDHMVLSVHAPKIEGKALRIRSYYGDGENDYVESQAFSVAEYIRAVNVDGFVAPVEGATPATEFAVAENAPYTLDYVEWCEYSGDTYRDYPKDWTSFSRPGKYYAAVRVSAKPGYMFEVGNRLPGKVTLNGETEPVDDEESFCWDPEYFKLWSIDYEFKQQYTVSFDANGGSGEMNAVKVDKDGDYVLPWNDFTAPEGTKVFAGWQIDEDTEKTYGELDKISVTKDITLKPVWEERETVKVSFQAGDHAVGETVERQMVNKSVIYLWADEMNAYAPEEGCTFAYWNVLTNGGSSQFRVDQTLINKGTNAIEVNGDTTITYVCEGKPEYTLSFDQNGGEGIMESITADVGTQITLPACTFTHPDGKLFLGWIVYAANDGEKTSLVKPGNAIAYTTNCVAKAKWSSNSYWNITFNANGGSGEMVADAVVQSNLYKLPVCTFTAPDGKVFDKWELAPDTYGAVGEKVAVGADITLKAVWKDTPSEEPTYWTVSYNANGGSGTMSAAQVNKGEQLTVPACGFTAPEGKEFDKWEVSSGVYAAAGEKLTVTADMTLKVVWKDSVWTVSFNANGGSGTMNAVSVVKGQKLTAPACGFGPAKGKRFVKWEISEGVYATAGEQITVNADMTIKAVWEDTIFDAGEVTTADDFTLTAKDVEGNAINVDVEYTKEVTFNNLNHVSQFNKASKSAVQDVKIDVDSSLLEYADCTVSFKNNKTSVVKKAGKEPAFTITFKAKKGVTTKAQKKVIAAVNKEMKKRTFKFTIKPVSIDDTTAAVVKLNKKQTKVTKVTLTIDGRTFKPGKKDYTYTIDTANKTVTIKANAGTNYTGEYIYTITP